MSHLYSLRVLVNAYVCKIVCISYLHSNEQRIVTLRYDLCVNMNEFAYLVFIVSDGVVPCIYSQ